MHRQTRILLTFLADEVTDSILEGLRDGPRTEAELVELCPAGQKTTNRRLKDLVDWEFVDYEVASAGRGKRGPRPRRFRISEPEAYRFSDDADAFSLALSEKKTERLRRHVEKQEKDAR